MILQETFKYADFLLKETHFFIIIIIIIILVTIINVLSSCSAWFCGNCDTFSQDSLMNKRSKSTAFILNFYNIINVFTVTFK